MAIVVYFVPGWMACDRDHGAEIQKIKCLWSNQRVDVEVLKWDSDCDWFSARENTDAAAAQLVHNICNRIRKRNCNPSDVFLCGHSLGVEVALKALAQMPFQVVQAFLLAGAVDASNENLIRSAVGNVQHGVINVHSDLDLMLEIFKHIEDCVPLGQAAHPLMDNLERQVFIDVSQMCELLFQILGLMCINDVGWENIRNILATTRFHGSEIYLDALLLGLN